MRKPRWRADELAFLREATAMRFIPREIAALLDRTPAAVASKRVSMGWTRPPPPPAPTPVPTPIYRVADIKAVVARHFDISPEVLSRSGRADSRPRHVAMLMARHVAKRSLPNIGGLFNRDHSTVLSGIRSITKLAAEDETLAAKISLIRSEIKPVDLSALALVQSQCVEA